LDSSKNLGDKQQDPKSANYWSSYWDLAVFLIAVLISLILFSKKILFLGVLFNAQPPFIEISQLVLVNFATYFGIVLWAYILLNPKSNWFLRIYVLFVGLLFTTLTRMVEGGVESTRQGVDFELVNHLLLALLGHAGLAEIIFKLSMQLGLFVFLGFGLWFRFYLNKKNDIQFPYKLVLIFISSLVVSFITPVVSDIPRSMARNGLVHVVATTWFPVTDMRKPSSFNFSKTKDKNLTANHKKSSQFFGVAKGMNVVVVALESTSANMLDFYPNNDAFEGSTPFLSKMAQNSLLINETSAVMTSTSKSLVSILCGIEPYLKTEVFEVTLGFPVDCLPKRLSDNGYDTVFFQSATKFYEGRDRLVDRAGFNTFIPVDDVSENNRVGMRSIGPLGLEDKVMLSAHKNWLKQKSNSSEPFMAFYMTLAQHHPYLPQDHSEDFQHRSDNHYMNDFVNSLFYVDQYLEEIVEQYKTFDLYENTIFIFVGDHGEGFGRYHMPWFHNNNLYREGLWVPFFIASEHLFKEMKEINGEYSLLDVAPSIEHLLGIDISDHYRGYQVFSEEADREVFAACWYKNRCLTKLDAKYKYIYNFDDTPEELYRRTDDFREQTNIAAKHPEVVKSYRESVFNWYNDVLGAYEAYYLATDNDYLEKPESYYKFPSEILPNKEQRERW
jgi:arylsulfatase A-like enzyme